MYLSMYVGIGDIFDHSQLNQHELWELVDNGLIVKLQDKYYTKTSKLGEVLMETMLQEVSDFCKIDVQKNWAKQAHQQVDMLFNYDFRKLVFASYLNM